MHARHEIAVDRGIAALIPFPRRIPDSRSRATPYPRADCVFRSEKGPRQQWSGKREIRGTVLSIARQFSKIFESKFRFLFLFPFVSFCKFLSNLRERERRKRKKVTKRKSRISVIIIKKIQRVSMIDQRDGKFYRRVHRTRRMQFINMIYVGR